MTSPLALPHLSLRPLSLLASVALLALSAACSSKDDSNQAPPPRNGVNDVEKACQIRAAWTNPGSDKCVSCQVAAQSPQCECEAFKDFAALCLPQDEARRAEPSCTTAVNDCAKACKPADCACVTGCYAQAERCKQRAAAKDGCIADVCAPYCN